VTEAARRPLPRWALALAGVALLVVAALVAGPTDGEVPLDPDGVGPEGLRGLREVLAEVGVHTDVALDPPADTDVRAFVPVDLLNRARREDWRGWVERGGLLVVADPASPLHGLAATGPGLADLVGATARAPGCDALASRGVAEVRHGSWVDLEVPDDARWACFPAGDGTATAWAVARPVGAGTVVALGSAAPFTNGALGRADHAVLAAALLAPAPGDRVVLVPRPPVGEGDEALLDLVAPRVWRGLGLLALATLLTLLWRGRRLGAPVTEPLPPVVPAAELARSVAGLLQRADDRAGAAAALRRALRRDVTEVLGAPAGTPPDRLAASLAARLPSLPADLVDTALVDRPVDRDEDLVHVARAVETCRSALRAGPGAAAPAPTAPPEAHPASDPSTPTGGTRP
jgi:hypothetical protein